MENQNNKPTTLEAIKDEYAREKGFTTWTIYSGFGVNHSVVDTIATRYAEAQTKELREEIERLKEKLQISNVHLNNAEREIFG